MDDDTYRADAGKQLRQHRGDVADDVRAALVDRLRYRPVDVTDPESVSTVLCATTGDEAETPVVAYASSIFTPRP